MTDLLARLKTILTADEIAYLALKPEPPAPPAPPASGDIIVSGVSNEYSTIDSWNCDCSKMLLRYPNGTVGMFSGDGRFVRMLPLNTSSEPRWHRTEPNSLYFVAGNSIRKMILGKDGVSDGMLILRTFNEFVVTTPKPGERNGISTKGEQDLSDDGQFLAFCGTKADGTEWVFRFDLKNQIVGPMVQIQLITDPSLPGLKTSAFDNIYMTPDNNILIGFYARGTARFNGVELYDKNMTFIRQITPYAAPHLDVLRDLKGDECIVTSDDAKPRPMMVRLADGQKTYFPEYGAWSQATHYSAASKGFFLVESYDPGTPDSQAPLDNAIHKYTLDGTRTTLRKHGASAQDYERQPKTSVSHRGLEFVYTVNGNAVIVKV